eukprot:933953-Rhodomonas_salina.5
MVLPECVVEFGNDLAYGAISFRLCYSTDLAYGAIRWKHAEALTGSVLPSSFAPPMQCPILT